MILFARHFFSRIVPGYILASLAGGIICATGLGLYAMSHSFAGGVFFNIISTTLIVILTGGICLLPFAGILIYNAERYGWRSVWYCILFPVPAILLAFAIFIIIFKGPPWILWVPQNQSPLSYTGYVRLNEWIVIAAAGLIAGAAYWTIAGRYSGQWRNKRDIPDKKSNPRYL